MLADVVRVGWMVAMTLALVWCAPSARPRTSVLGFSHRMAVVTATAIAGVSVLSSAHLLNWFTLLLTYAAPALVAWLRAYGWAPEGAFRQTVRRAAIAAAARIERGSLLRPRLHRVNTWRPSRDAGYIIPLGTGLLAAAIVRLLPVLGETRLASPDAYALLLDTRLALFNAPRAWLIDPVAAIAAALSIATSLNPSHVVRLLGPALGVATVGAAAAVACRLTGHRAAGIAVVWVLGALTVGDRFASQWIPNDGTLGLFFALLCVLAALEVRVWSRFDPAARTAALCAALAAVAAPWTLVVLTLIPAASVCRRAVRAPQRFLPGDRRRLAQPAVIAATVIACVMLVPVNASPLYLEHDIAARKALEIATTFPRGKWLVVGPLEQLSMTYGRGWFEDQLTFLGKYRGRTADPTFRFEVSVDEVLVFVERRPFKTFEVEASFVPFAAMTDAVYRHYRSQAGRATVQAELRTLCQDYMTAHENASIYYDDDDLTIFRFPITR